MSAPRVTAERLREMRACAEHVAIVEREWPDGVPVTVPSIQKAFRLGLDVEWFSRRVLGYPALAEYERVTIPAWAEFAGGLRLAAYGRVTASAYERARALAWAEYGRARALALAPRLRVALRGES